MISLAHLLGTHTSKIPKNVMLSHHLLYFPGYKLHLSIYLYYQNNKKTVYLFCNLIFDVPNSLLDQLYFQFILYTFTFLLSAVQM